MSAETRCETSKRISTSVGDVMIEAPDRQRVIVYSIASENARPITLGAHTFDLMPLSVILEDGTDRWVPMERLVFTLVKAAPRTARPTTDQLSIVAARILTGVGEWLRGNPDWRLLAAQQNIEHNIEECDRVMLQIASQLALQRDERVRLLAALGQINGEIADRSLDR